MIGLRLDGYDFDFYYDVVVVFCICVRDDELFSFSY